MVCGPRKLIREYVYAHFFTLQPDIIVMCQRLNLFVATQL